MSAMQENKEVILKLYEQALNKKNTELIQDLVSDEYISINGKKGIAAFEEPVEALVNAFPDVQWKIKNLIGEGDKVVVRWNLQGTHSGPFQNITATGKKVSNDGIGFYELKDGKIIRSQIHTDRLGILQKLGVIPLDLASPANSGNQQDHIRFIDKFLVPEAARQEFLQRVAFNRNFIKTLPGFIEDAAYERTDEQGNLIFITIAVWQNEQVLKDAKEAVQAEYQKQGFNPAEFFEKENITMERGTYKEAVPQP